MRLAVSNIAFAPQDRLAAYAAMADAGFTGLEIAPGLFFPDADDPFQPAPAQVTRAMAELAGAGLTLVSMQSLLFGVTGAALFGDDAEQARFRAGMARAIALAGRLGIPNLVFGSPGQRRIPDGMSQAAATDHAALVFRDLGDLAQTAGCVIALEPNPADYGTNFLNTLDQAARFAGFVDHPAVRLVLDVGAMVMNGQFDDLAHHLGRAAARINHVHVSEPQLAPAPATPQRAAQVLSGLRALGYDKAVSIEMRPPEGGLATLAAQMARLAAAKEG